MAKQILRIIKWLFVLATVFAAAALLYAAVKIREPLRTEGGEQVFVVPAGTTTKQVARALADARLINRAFFFELYIYFQGASGKLQAGRYLLSPDESIVLIARKMERGDVISDAVRITVIEGLTVADIGEALQAKGLVSRAEFVAANSAQEGYLFPDTYFIGRRETGVEIAKKMKDNFTKKAGEVSRRQLILASIVEREVGRNVRAGEKLTEAETAKLQEERRLVAGVFENRLALGMPLQSDATVAYVTGSKSDRATLAELKVDSPYNTYLHKGLPPGPISNPGLAAIRAAKAPAATDYLYFLTDAGGTAYFAKTFREHEINKNEYLRSP